MKVLIKGVKMSARQNNHQVIGKFIVITMSYWGHRILGTDGKHMSDVCGLASHWTDESQLFESCNNAIDMAEKYREQHGKFALVYKIIDDAIVYHEDVNQCQIIINRLGKPVYIAQKTIKSNGCVLVVDDPRRPEGILSISDSILKKIKTKEEFDLLIKSFSPKSLPPKIIAREYIPGEWIDPRETVCFGKVSKFVEENGFIIRKVGKLTYYRSHNFVG